MNQSRWAEIRELLRDSVRGYPGLMLASGAVAAVNAVALAGWGPWMATPMLFVDLAVVTVLFCVLVSRSVAVHRALMRSRDRYVLAARGSTDGLWEWDVNGGRVYYDARWKDMLGYADEAVGSDISDWLGRVHPEDVDTLRSDLDAHAAGATPKLERQYRIRDAAGSWRWMLARGLAVRDRSGRVSRMAGSQTDIGHWKREEARLLHDALHDPLTGLPNRALFLDRLERVSERGRRHNQSRYAVLFLDLDRFKVVNDGLGHLVGDELLKVIARRLLLCVRQEDTVARLGGDEFGILLSEPRDLADATRVAERVNASLLQPVHIGENEVFTSVSVGVALSQPGYTDPDEILRDADAAMYRAKSAGGMRYEVEGGALHTEAVQRLRMETELRRSMDRGELRLEYQPIVELLPGAGLGASRLTGFEALVRWQHPERGLLMPGEFLPLAEETGIILALDWWVLSQACEDAARWGDALGAPGGPTPMTISVNLSGKHFWHEDFIARLDRVLAATGARPEHLKLEITESAVMRDADAATRVLAEVRRRGIGLAIDDFGTGYSSLTYLQRFPVDAVKIDRSFVEGIGNGARNTELVRSILALARALGLEAVAEGVETTDELRELTRMGCGLAQGYLFSHPLGAEEAGALLLSRSSGPARPVMHAWTRKEA